MRPDLPLPDLPSRIAGLDALAANLWWSWHPAARSLFAELSPALWRESGENPVRLLRCLPASALAAAAATPRSAAGTTW